ncbi:MAG: hypothetical protein ING71_15990 [Rhodocyclaceae bacterium]|nr:hypothetical protein [Rhodocyclaceae bacterium]
MTIPIRNLYYLFCYAWEKYPDSNDVEVGVDESPDLPNLFAQVLLNGMNRLLRRGLDRLYLSSEDELRSPKGRLLLDESLKSQTFERGAVICRFDELSVDVLHNQLLKATVRLLRRDPAVKPKLAAALGVVDKRLSWVADIHVTTDLFSRVQLSRQTGPYVQLLRLCEFVWRSAMPEEGGKGSRFGDILRDEVRMSEVFELFVLNFFRQHGTGYSAAREIMRWQLDEGGSGDRSLLPTMQTDVTLRSKDHVVVLDAKFYANPFVQFRGGAKFNSGHLYQLYAYLRHAGRDDPMKPISGALIYASPKGRSIHRYRVDGFDVAVATIDLSQPWSDIHSDMIDLIKRTEIEIKEPAFGVSERSN